MDALFSVLKEYGPWGFLLFVGVYLLLMGEIKFRYPRPPTKQKNE